MPTLHEINEYMNTWAKPEYSESWDNDGIMLCGNLDKNIEKVTVCLEINAKIIEDAKKQGSELIITHHPFIFRPMRNIRGVEFDYVSELISASVAVFSYHTRLDSACGGVNDVLAKKLGLTDICPFAELGRIGKLSRPIGAREFADHIKNTLGCGTMRCSVNENKNIETVAVLGGAGKDFVELACECADAYVTADLSHNSFITANEHGLCLFDAGHYFTENPVTEEIAGRLRTKFPKLQVSVSDSCCPYTLI
ncbi:MAG: Nif3-like dinuclear metal center hexameric protein [Clostridia bacterium]|nr:Nif3-like dinuclear metal center hexameric protein [Clostridia bacterium]